MKVEFYKHNLGLEEKEQVQECLGGVFLTTGQYVKNFEDQFATYLGVKHAVGLSSGTAALHLSLLALGVGPGDEVITTPMTFVATSNAILYTGARPVFVDVQPDTGLIDPRNIVKAVTPRTKAIIPVHLYGQLCDMRAIMSIAQAHGLKVVEDAAHCLEGERDGVRPGQLGDMACFSFYATKNMTCGEGGAIATNDGSLTERIKVLRNHGMSKGAADRHENNFIHWDLLELGWKYNMSNIQAAILLPQLLHIERRWLLRDVLYKQYTDKLRDVPGVRIPGMMAGAKSGHHLLAIRVGPGFRDDLLRFLFEKGIGCGVHYRAVHLLYYYRLKFGYQEGCYPKAEMIGNETLSLPFWIGISEGEINMVVDAVRDFLTMRADR